MVIKTGNIPILTRESSHSGPKPKSLIKIKPDVQAGLNSRFALSADDRKRLSHQAKTLIEPRLPIATSPHQFIQQKKEVPTPPTHVGAGSITQAPATKTRESLKLASGATSRTSAPKTSVNLSELLPIDKNEMSLEDWQKFLRGELYPDFWRNLKENLEAQGMDVSSGVVLCATLTKNAGSISFKRADGKLPKSSTYACIHMSMTGQSFTVENVTKINPHIAYEALFFNKDVHLSESVLQEATLCLIESSLMKGIERSPAGWPAMTAEEFKDRLRETQFSTRFKELKSTRPELQDLDVVLVSIHRGANIKGISIKKADHDYRSDGHKSHIRMRMNDQGVTIETVENLNPHIAYEALFYNPDVQFSESALQEAALSLIEARFMQGQDRKKQSWLSITREEFNRRLSETPFTTLFHDLQTVRPELTTLNCVLVSDQYGTTIRAIGLRNAAGELPQDKSYSHIYIDMNGHGATVQKVEKLNARTAYQALFYNPDVQFSESALQEAALSLIEDAFMSGIERGKSGWPQITREEFIKRLQDISFTAYFQKLQTVRPELTDLDCILVSRHEGSTIGSIALKQANDDISNYSVNSLIQFHINGQATWVEKIEKLNPHIYYEALFFNTDIKFSEPFLQEAALCIIEVRFMHGLDRSNQGWTSLTREEFIQRLRTAPLMTIFRELQAARPGLTDFNLVLVSQHNGTPIRGIGFKQADSELPNSSNYSHIHINFNRQNVVILSVAKKYKSLIYLTLTHNPELSIDPLLAIRMGSLSAEDRLLYRLSEQGRTLILDELRSEHFEDKVVDYDSDSGSDYDVFEAVTAAEFQSAAYRVLVKIGVAFDASDPWEDRDPRYTIARELHHYLAGTPIPPEYATAVSDLLIAGEFRTRERELSDYHKVLRDAGKAPISESGWDDVFSVDLRTRLREFANDYFNFVGIENPAQVYLRDPFNEALGAFYWEMYKEGNTAFKTEILIHLRYQQRRGDSLSEFYDGVQKQSGRERESAVALVQHDLKGLEEQHSLWQLNVEEPFRLVNGIVGGAAHFLWGTVFDEVAQRSLMASARKMFPRHEFEDDSDLSELLPQNLFFEVVGLTAKQETKSEPYVPTFAEGIRKLQFLMGVGETTHVSFRRGFGEGSILGLMSDIVDELMLKHPKEFREYLEGSWVYQRNEINESGEYHQVPIEIRHGDLLEKLFQGYDLQAMTGKIKEFPNIIRGFRLGEENEAILMRRMQHAYEDYQRDGEMDADDARLIAEQMSLWYLSPGIKAKKGDRWYLFEQWLKSITDDGELLFDAVFKAVEEFINC